MGVGKLSIAIAAAIALTAGPVVSGTISGVVKIDAKKIPPARPVKMQTDPINSGRGRHAASRCVVQETRA